MKKGQISVFIIFAIVLLVTGLISYYIYKNSNRSNEDYFMQPETKPQVDNIVDSVNTCMRISAEESLTIIGLQGGYYNPPAQSYDLGWLFMPFYYFEGKFLIPDITTIENEISTYYSQQVFSCINNIDTKDIELKSSIPKIKTTVQKDRVAFFSDAPLILKKEGRTIKYDLKDFPMNYPSKLYEMHGLSRYIVESYRKDPPMICIDCINDMVLDSGLYIEFTDFDDGIRSVAIADNSSFNPYIFEFLIKNKEGADENSIIPKASLNK